MNETIFDLIEEPVGDGKQGYFDAASNAPEPKDDSWYSKVQDYGKTILKGGAEGLARVGLMMNPIPYTGKSQEQQLQEYSEQLNRQLPTEDDFGQKAIRRGLQQAPSAVAFPGSSLAMIPRALGAGVLGEGAKELGAPEWLQTATELTAYIGPDITKKLLEKGSNKEIIAAAKKMGLTDEQITPLIQSDFKQKWLTKIAPRRGKTQEALENTKQGLQEAYSKLAESPQAKNALDPEAYQKLYKNIGDKLFEMPSGVRDKIAVDFKDLLKNPISGKTLMNFWVDINHEMGKSSKQLSLLKDPIKKAMAEIDPEMSKNFETVNALYTKFYPIAKKLEPNLYTDVMSASKALGSLVGVVTGDYRVLSAAGLHMTGAKAAQLLLTNPRFQQLGNKMADALNQGKFAMAKKVGDLIALELKKSSPEVAKEIESLSEQDFMDLISHKTSSQKK